MDYLPPKYSQGKKRFRGAFFFDNNEVKALISNVGIDISERLY